MDQDKFNLAYGENTRLNGALKQIPSKFLTSDINWGLEVSEGDRPAEPFMPNRYAPIVRDIRTVSLFQKGVVIPTGTIISANPVMNYEFYNTVSTSGFGDASGSVASGNVALGIGYDGSTLLQSDMEDMIEGYDRIRLVAEIANGGTAATDTYTAFDVDRGRVKADGTIIAAGNTYARPVNIPVGFTTEDIYLFDQGGSINFSEVKWNRFSSFATDYFIEMPYLVNGTYDVYDALGANYATPGTASDAYTEVLKLGMPLFWAGAFADMKVGAFVQSDLNGKWRPQVVGASAAAATKTAQTVGKLISFTNKFPGDLEGNVETWYNKNAANYGKNYTGATSTGGTATFGLEYRLFVTIATALQANSVAINFANVKAFLNSGQVGIARVNVHTS